MSRSATTPAAADAPPLVGAPPAGLHEPITLRTLRRMVDRGEKIACLTCYDALTARWLQAGGVPLLLVGDTAAEMILGLPGTIHAPLDFLLTITAAVRRGAPTRPWYVRVSDSTFFFVFLCFVFLYFSLIFFG